MAKTLEIIDLHASVEDKEILKGVNLIMKTGEVHAIMGPNGTGKSTLTNVIMGHPKYKITSGKILLDGEDITNLKVDERARKGLFLAMQYPAEVSGLTNSEFVRAAVNAVTNKEQKLFKFIVEYDKAVQDLKMREDLPHRYLNEGFSGGEKKRNEILQMKMIKPFFAMLDEIDSGLDVDALKIVAENVNAMLNENFGCLLITHYERLLDYIKPNFVHIMLNGNIVRSGGNDLIERIDQEGYDWIKNELGIVDEVEERIILGSCAKKGNAKND